MPPPPIVDDTFEDPESPTPPPKRRKGSGALLLVGCLVLLAAVMAGAYVLNLADTFNTNSGKIEQAFPEDSARPKPAERVNGTAPKNILLMGSDSRTAPELDAVSAEASDQRADALMLLHIPADRQNVYAVSIMRDLWVNIPNHGQSKINSALAYGGVPLMVHTVESLFNQRIDHVAIVDFEGFKGLTNALGGVEIDVPLAFTSTHGNYSFTAGPILMDGDQALSFVRERYSFADGDYQRVRNQQAFLKALVGKTIKSETRTNPATVSKIVQSISPFVHVDRTFDAGTLAGLIFELSEVGDDNFAAFTVPTNGTGTSSDGQSIVLPNPEAISNISDALAADSLGAYVTANNFQGGN